jgi:hypothetical protein
VVAAVAAPALSMSLSACGNAQTDEQYQPGVGANVRSGPVQLFNALAVANGDETATVSVAIRNETSKPIRLISASGRLSNGKKVTTTVSPAIIAAEETVSTGPAGSVILEAPDLAAGQYVTLTLKFSAGNSATVEAPIVERISIYDDVATGPGGETARPQPDVEEPADEATAESAPAHP